ncbi:hypothetical protein [Pseudomonas savastanoi]|uniref:hypothetical protein n=1 Tax=Pseudomonas savastanoi TaxID=29438 RepID=UPI001784F5FF|nr:hypothetical protein [Pseudomonas savastanoi]QOI07933.1 hypothetical protein D5S10_29865 [Pseudomonas savastanoi]
MARSDVVIQRLKAEQAQNPDVPHYECKPDETNWPLQPSEIKTAGYWKLEGRRVPKGVEPTAFVVSGQGGKLHGTKVLTRWVAAYHITQTVPVKSHSAAK